MANLLYVGASPNALYVGSVGISAVYVGPNGFFPSSGGGGGFSTAAWLPTNASTVLALWLDPSDAATRTAPSGRVTILADKSPAKNDFYALGLSTGLATMTQNGITALVGSGGYGNDALTNSGPGLNNVTNAANTFVCAAGIIGTPVGINAAFNIVTSARAYGWVYDTSTTSLKYRHGNTTDSGSNLTSAVTVLTHSGTSLIGYANGTMDSSTANAIDFVSSSSTISVGGASQTWIFGGWVGDCLIYSGVLSTFDRQRLEGYLTWKWGLQSSLPSGHPYKSAAPRVGVTITLSSSNYGSPFVIGYARSGNDEGYPTFGSLSAEPFTGFTVDLLRWNSSIGTNMKIVGDSTSLGTLIFTVNNVYWGSSAGTFDGNVTNYTLSPPGSSFANATNYTINIA